MTAVASWLVLYGGTLIGQDSATQFYPWYDYLGERLQAGEIPAWNPYQFGGAPFAGDPQSGWMYLPAMLFFTAFPLSLAVPFFLIFHLALAGLATYALARRLMLGPGGALVAAAAYQLSGLVLGRSVCCPATLEVATWAPVALLGASVAIRSQDRVWRGIGWLLAGLALSQALAAWLGQGSYYVLLALGAFIAYRTLLAPVDPARRLKSRIGDLALHGGAILAIGFGLAAAGVLPRLEYVTRSNLAGGEYNEHNAWAADIGGVTPGMILGRLFDPSLHYPGTVAAILAILAVWLARRWFAMRFFAVFGIVALILAMPWDTPLHLLFYTTLPWFESLHQHRPERVALVGYLAIALLAGAAVDGLSRQQFQSRRIWTTIVAPVVAVMVLLVFGDGMPLAAIGLLAATTVLVTLALVRNWSISWAVPALLVIVVAGDLLLGFRDMAAQAPYGGFHRVDLETYYSPSGAVAFLRQETADEPGRYAGFDPEHRAITDGQLVLYRYQFADDDTVDLLVNNRGTLHGVEDVQGYNPIQSQRFVEYLTALNGHPQEYHDANIYFGGVTSPLLDLLNVRYLLIPAEIPADRQDLQALYRALPTVYSDSDVKVLENPAALPRAWIVHEAQQVGPGEALPLLSSGSVDPWRTALLDIPPPPLEPAVNPEAEDVTILSSEPERLRFGTYASAPGLLMVSEVYDPNWRAYIDGEPADILPADYMFRSVPLPAGHHIVELRYEPPMLQTGLIITAVTATMIMLPGLALAWSRLRGRYRSANASTSGDPVPQS